MWGNLSPLPQGRGGFWAQSSCSSGGLRLGITGGFALSPPAGYKPTSVDRTLAPPPASASRGRRRQLFVLLGPLASFLGQSRALPLPAGTGLPVPRLPPRLPLPLAFELIPPRGAQAGGCPLEPPQRRATEEQPCKSRGAGPGRATVTHPLFLVEVEL